MFGCLIKWAAKKYILSSVNEILEARKAGVDKALSVVAKCVDKVQSILDFLASVKAKLDDGKLTDDEVDTIVEQGKNLATNLVK